MEESTPTPPITTRAYKPSVVEWDSAGKVLDDSRAALAIEGMPASPIADQLEKCEKLYQDWKADHTGFIGGMVKAFAWFVGSHPETGIKILRAMLADLAIAHAKLQNDAKAYEINRETTAQVHKIHGDHAALRAFLYSNFNAELMEADAVNKPLLQLCKEIMMKVPR